MYLLKSGTRAGTMRKMHLLRKTLFYLALISVGVLLVSFFFINPILEKVTDSYLKNTIKDFSEQKQYELGYDAIEINILKGQLRVINLQGSPIEERWEQFRNGNTKVSVLKEISVSNAELRGLQLWHFLWDGELELHSITVDELQLNLYRNNSSPPKSKVSIAEQKKKFSLDSLRLPGLEYVKLGKIQFENYGLHILDMDTKDTISSYAGTELRIDKVSLHKSPQNKSPFLVYDLSELKLLLEQQNITPKGGTYAIAFQKLTYTLSDNSISIQDFSFKPRISKEGFKEKERYSFEIYDCAFDSLKITGFKIMSLFDHAGLVLDKIEINGLNASVYRDKTKPMNTGKKVALPLAALAKIKYPLQIDTILIVNSFFQYSELLPKNQKLLKVDFAKLNLEAYHINSVGHADESYPPLKILLSTDILNNIPLSVEVKMPYHSPNSTFYYSGKTQGDMSFVKLTPVLYPATGISFSDGTLKSIAFNGIGNGYNSQGELIMLYDNLEIELFDKENSENDAIHWVANGLVKSSNPNKRGKIIVGRISTDRVLYKGLGNYLWKSLESGMINTFNPLAKHGKKR